MRITHLVVCLSVGCADPIRSEPEPDQGTQVGDEGDDLRCIEVRDEIPLDDTRHGTLDLSAQDVVDLAEVPVSGELVVGEHTAQLTLTLTHTGRIWYAHDEPRDATVDPTECTVESYYAEARGTLTAGDLLDEEFESEVWSFQAGHVFVGPRFDLEQLQGTLHPQRIVPEQWDEVSLHAFGGSDQGIWTFHLDWDAVLHDTGDSDREDIADLSLYPDAPMR